MGRNKLVVGSGEEDRLNNSAVPCCNPLAGMHGLASTPEDLKLNIDGWLMGACIPEPLHGVSEGKLKSVTTLPTSQSSGYLKLGGRILPTNKAIRPKGSVKSPYLLVLVNLNMKKKRDYKNCPICKRATGKPECMFPPELYIRKDEKNQEEKPISDMENSF